MFDNNIRGNFTSVHGPKRNWRVKSKLALGVDGGKAASLEFQIMFDDAELPA